MKTTRQEESIASTSRKQTEMSRSLASRANQELVYTKLTEFKQQNVNRYADSNPYTSDTQDHLSKAAQFVNIDNQNLVSNPSSNPN